jgi:hypothetical protein
VHLLTGLAMLLAGVPKDFGLEALVASKDLQEKHKEYLFTMGNCESGRK